MYESFDGARVPLTPEDPWVEDQPIRYRRMRLGYCRHLRRHRILHTICELLSWGFPILDSRLRSVFRVFVVGIFGIFLQTNVLQQPSVCMEEVLV